MKVQAKSLEDMAREKLNRYMVETKTIINGKEFILSPAWPVMIAAKKAAAASPNFADLIYKIAKQMGAS